jgi:hypothetical protein
MQSKISPLPLLFLAGGAALAIAGCKSMVKPSLGVIESCRREAKNSGL